MRRLVLVGVLLFGVLFLVLPPAPLESLDLPGSPTLTSGPARRVLLGAYHIHSRASDGSGDIDEIAAAAAQAGLSFIIITDHGTGTRASAAPTYRHGVLCIEGVEISTTGGHYVALGMRQSTYPLRGFPDHVAEDVARLGGFGVVAHPDSPKTSLAWNDWEIPFDGLEWFSLDSQWRDESYPSMLKAFAAFWMRPAPALSMLLDQPTVTLQRWDRLALARRVVGLTAVDTHARLAAGGAPDPLPPDALAISFPSYASSFGVSVMGVELDAPPSGEASLDGVALLQALRSGRVYGVMAGLANPGTVSFTASQAGTVVRMGEEVQTARGPVRFRAEASAPQGGELRLLRNGTIVQRGPQIVQLQATEPGVYRLEVHLARAPGTPPMAWVVTNPIYLRDTTSRTPDASSGESASPLRTLALDRPRLEQDGDSRASVEPDGAGGFLMTYALAPNGPVAPWVASAWPLPDEARGLTGFDVTMASDAPARVSWQLRSATAGDERWRTSVFVGPEPRRLTVRFSDFRPVRENLPRLSPRASGTALLLVIDSVNSEPGASGRLRVSFEGWR
jgi:hypothetical protein